MLPGAMRRLLGAGPSPPLAAAARRLTKPSTPNRMGEAAAVDTRAAAATTNPTPTGSRREPLWWATVDPDALSAANPGLCANLVGGHWCATKRTVGIVDPLHGDRFIVVPDTQPDELEPFVRAAAGCPKSGLHNPLMNPQRYVLYGDVAARAARALARPETERFFARLIQRVVPKHIAQCEGEVRTVRRWLETMAGDGVRQLARSFAVPGDHFGQETRGYRWPFGNVAVISPFNFPLEIPSLQTLSALFMGNRPLLKVDEKVSIVMEQLLRMLTEECGMPASDVDLLYSSGAVCNELLLRSQPRSTMFTGSQHVAEKLTRDMKGRVRLEDAGFDWKLLGPDPHNCNVEHVAWQSDQDAYGFSGQKCSAQSMLIVHSSWADTTPLYERMRALAARRSLDDLTICPVITATNEQMDAHVSRLCTIPGARVMFGGRPLTQPHRIPAVYGSYEPTAVFVPLRELVKPEHFAVATTEVFGPVQVVTEYGDEDLNVVLDCFERMENHLTAAVVSQEPGFVNTVLGRTVNGTTYVGARARTTGAPANHWFGPCGDPRAGGIHTAEAIQSTWSGHREIVVDTMVPDATMDRPCT